MFELLYYSTLLNFSGKKDAIFTQDIKGLSYVS